MSGLSKISEIYRVNVPQKAKYKGEIFPSDQPVGNYGIDSFELFGRDRKQNRKGIIAIDLGRWNP